MEFNKNISKAEKTFEKAIRDRDQAMYNEEEGLYIRTQIVKKYVKSVFGATSPEFAQVRAIELKDRDPD